nr:hypothetical protein [Tanacetum cinerariifolium]
FLHHSSANSWQWDLYSSGSGNTLHWQWELSPGSGNALCILFPTPTTQSERDTKMKPLNMKLPSIEIRYGFKIRLKSIFRT